MDRGREMMFIVFGFLLLMAVVVCFCVAMVNEDPAKVTLQPEAYTLTAEPGPMTFDGDIAAAAGDPGTELDLVDEDLQPAEPLWSHTYNYVDAINLEYFEIDGAPAVRSGDWIVLLSDDSRRKDFCLKFQPRFVP